MFTFLHAADIHLDSPFHKLDRYEGAPVAEFRQATRRAFENLVRLAIAEKVAFVIIAGDLYDGDWKDYNTGLYLVSRMGALRDAGIPVFVAAGNHDAASAITKTLRFPENVTLFPAHHPATFLVEKVGAALHGQSFATPAEKRDLSRGYPPAVPGRCNIGVLHTCASGREGHEPYAPCSLEVLRNKGYDYWALGHVHQREVLQEDPPVVFSGNTQGRHAKETGAKGCYLVSVDDHGRIGVQFRSLDVVRWATARVDAGGAESGYEVVERFIRHLEELVVESDGLPLAVRVEVKGETLACDEILSDVDRWTNEIRSAAVESGGGGVWVEKIAFRLRMPVGDRFPHVPGGAVGELLHLLDELDADPGSRVELGAELADLEKKLPRELKTGPEALRLEDEHWLGDLLAQVRPLLVRRLLRKGDAL